MELILIVVFVVAAIGLVVYSVWPGRGEAADAVERRAAGLKADDPLRADMTKRVRSMSKPTLIERAAPMLSRVVMPKQEGDQTALKVKLAGAGFRNESAVTVFLASKLISAAFFGGVALLFAIQFNKPMMNMFGMTAFCGGFGFLMPEIWLWSARRKRIESIRNGLPDALDLMVVSVEAGLGLDAALLRVGDEMRNVHMDLSEEMQIATVEVQMGIQRGEALKKMATRAGVEEMKALVAVIVQAEKLGTSIAKALRVQADALRTKRRQRAEERAQKTAVKLMLPLILFIFPAILIVLGVPAGIKLAQTLGGNGPLSGS